MEAKRNVELVMDAFQKVEARDEEGLVALYHPDIKFHWPPSLHYGARRIDPSGNPWGPAGRRPGSRSSQLRPSGAYRLVSSGRTTEKWLCYGTNEGGRQPAKAS